MTIDQQYNLVIDCKQIQHAQALNPNILKIYSPYHEEEWLEYDLLLPFGHRFVDDKLWWIKVL